MSTERNKVETLKFSVVDQREIQIPEYAENLNTPTFVNWGPDNKFPEFINKLYNESATLRSVIDGTAEFIAGNGVSLENGIKWEQEVNRNGMDVSDLVLAMSTDMLKYNRTAVQVIFNKLGIPVELFPLDFSRIRLSPDNGKVYYAPKWGSYTTKFKEYDRWNPEKIDPENPTQIYVWKAPSTRTVYPIPFWRGCFRDAMAEICASKYTLNSLANGLAVKSVINLPNTTGALTDDDKQKVMEGIRENFTGPDATSSFLLYWVEEGEQPLSIDSVQTQDESDKFEKIQNSARSRVFTAFRATPNLFGLPNETKGFSKEEFLEAFSLYNKTMCMPRQKQIQRVLEKIMNCGVTILPFNLDDDKQD